MRRPPHLPRARGCPSRADCDGGDRRRGRLLRNVRLRKLRRPHARVHLGGPGLPGTALLRLHALRLCAALVGLHRTVSIPWPCAAPHRPHVLPECRRRGPRAPAPDHAAAPGPPLGGHRRLVPRLLPRLHRQRHRPQRWPPGGAGPHAAAPHHHRDRLLRGLRPLRPVPHRAAVGARVACGHGQEHVRRRRHREPLWRGGGAPRRGGWPIAVPDDQRGQARARRLRHREGRRVVPAHGPRGLRRGGRLRLALVEG
mmetsp:Transcript_13867/g.46891  ORF Transcript_13867/g.46891 Transcript_13867/m.46891 type:complete len:255 (-) Transcript_13867:1496-2260(-)